MLGKEELLDSVNACTAQHSLASVIPGLAGTLFCEISFSIAAADHPWISSRPHDLIWICHCKWVQNWILWSMFVSILIIGRDAQLMNLPRYALSLSRCYS